jgi:hypothetical protein
MNFELKLSKIKPKIFWGVLVLFYDTFLIWTKNAIVWAFGGMWV